MALSIGGTPPSSPRNIDDDSTSQLTDGNLFPTPLTIQQALTLASKMRDGLKSHTKDRKWRLKRYDNCFKATHALSWALENISSDDTIAVNRLNQLVDFGLISHVVDPLRKFRVGETRTLYFRMIHGVLDADYSFEEDDKLASSEGGCPGKGIPLLTGTFGVNAGAHGNNIEAMQQQIMNLDHILQETAQELNSTRGKLEIVHQKVLNLVSQQITTFLTIFALYIYIVFVSFLTSARMSLSSLGLLGISMILSARYGWRCISLWSDLDSQTVPLDSVTVGVDDESSLATQSSVIGNLKSYDRKPTAASITSLLSKSLRSVTGGRSLRKAQSIITREVFMRDHQ